MSQIKSNIGLHVAYNYLVSCIHVVILIAKMYMRAHMGYRMADKFT